MDATRQGQLDLVRGLLDKVADPNAKLGGWTELMEAAQHGHTSIVEVLPSNGADVNARDYNGATALMDATFSGNLFTVQTLLAKGADPHVKTEKTVPIIRHGTVTLAPPGLTALKRAELLGHTAIAELLKKAGAME